MRAGGALVAAALAWLVPACAPPPAGVAAGTDASVPPLPVDAGTLIDAAMAAADAAPVVPPDACVPVVADDDAGAANPFGIRLTDVTMQMPEQFLGGRTDGDRVAFGSGTALADLDGDGDLDVLLARNDSGTTYAGGPATLLENQGGFDRLVPHPGFTARFVGKAAHAVSTADYDGDGDLDVFVGLETTDVLLRNDGNLTFTDVTATAGVGGPADTHTSGGIWADVNRDGLIDLYVTTHTPDFGVYTADANANRLYLNQGDGSFRDVTEYAGVGGNGSTHAALIGDLDADGELEIYVANDRFASNGQGGVLQLDGDRVYDLLDIDDLGRPRFVDRSYGYGITDPRSAMGIALADIDHDGIDDVYVTDFGPNHVERWNPAGPSYVSDFGYYGLNVGSNPDGDLLVSWGARFVDLDRDGWLEALVINGAVTAPVPCSAQRQRDRFLRSEGGIYADITDEVGMPAGWPCPSGTSEPISGRGVTMGDLDGDGDDDFIIAPFIEAYRFVRNDTPNCERAAARLRLRGTVSTAEAVGSVIEVELADGRTIRRPVYTGGDTYSQSDRVIEVPLPSPATSARVRWASGITQSLAPSGLASGVIEEPRWLTLEPRVVGPTDPPAMLSLTLLDDDGIPLGPAGAGRVVIFVRGDGIPTTTVDGLDGTYRATLPHAGESGPIAVTIYVDGDRLLPRPGVWFR